jgi:hypothetical protein
VAALALAGLVSACALGERERPQATQPQTTAPFGAVAYDPDSRAWSLVSDRPNLSLARTAALEQCAAPGCVVTGVFARGTCATLSLDADRASRRAHMGVAQDPETAQSMARVSCREDGGTDCKAAPAVCN